LLTLFVGESHSGQGLGNLAYFDKIQVTEVVIFSWKRKETCLGLGGVPLLRFPNSDLLESERARSLQPQITQHKGIPHVYGDSLSHLTT
jgi:hypothetical protein